MPRTGIDVRRAEASEIDAIVELAAAALGWDPDAPNDAFFRWKHLDNPFGASPMWVAVDDGRLVGVRVLMRWRFRRADGTTTTAVRAVDTATHPDARGQGVFGRLTLAAVDELRAEGVGAVFNTPNDQSRPGYLKMGWEVLGRVPIVMRPAGPRGALRAVRARTPAQKWSRPIDAGEPAATLLADAPAITALLASVPSSRGLATDRSPEQLAWRYGFEPLHYRAVAAARDPRQGLVVFRVRGRGAATEATVCEVLVPDDDPTTTAHLVREVRRLAHADYLVWAGRRLPARTGFVPLPRQGPVLTWRVLADDRRPALGDLALSLGDVELF